MIHCQCQVIITYRKVFVLWLSYHIYYYSVLWNQMFNKGCCNIPMKRYKCLARDTYTIIVEYFLSELFVDGGKFIFRFDSILSILFNLLSNLLLSVVVEGKWLTDILRLNIQIKIIQYMFMSGLLLLLHSIWTKYLPQINRSEAIMPISLNN